MDGLDWRKWREVRTVVLERDDYQCTAGPYDVERCHGGLHVHHADPEADPYDPNRLYTICARHHAKLHHLMKTNERRLAA